MSLGRLRTIACVMTITLLVLLSLSTAKVPGPRDSFILEAGSGEQSFTLTRLTNISETENNNLESSANNLNKDLAPFNLSGSLPSTSDQDWFKLTLTGGSGPVDNVTITPTDITYPASGTTALIIWVYRDHPRSTDSNLIHSEYWWRSSGPWNSQTFYAMDNGTYYLQVQLYASSGGSMTYELRINVTSSTPPDSYNDKPSALALNGNKNNESLTMPFDWSDWFRIPLPDSSVPTQLNFSVDVTASYAGTWGSWKVVVAVNLFLIYRLKSNPGSLTYEKYQLSRDSETGFTTPKDVNFNKNITEFYLCLTIDTWGYDSGSPSTRFILDSPESLAWANYSITGFKSEAVYPNKAPVLLNGMVTPDTGRTDESYTYSVLYTDPEGDYPTSVQLTYNSNTIAMTKSSGGGNDFLTGVPYDVVLSGASLGEGTHHFSFQAIDCKGAAALGDINLHTGPVIDDNYIPFIKTAAPVKIILHEDQPAGYAHLDMFFDDVDPQTLDHRILNGADWSKVLTTPLAQFTIIDSNSTLKIVPEAELSGEMSVKLNTTDGEAWLAAPHTFIINITPVNDDPVFKKVGGKVVSGPTVNLMAVQGEWADIVLEAEDLADGDDVFFSSNIASVIDSPEQGVNYDFDPAGTLSIKPSDKDVGSSLTVNISAHDDNGGLSWVHAVFNVQNSNDPPVLDEVGDQTVKQYQWLEFTLTAQDIDMDSGDALMYFSNIAEVVPGLSAEENLFFGSDNGSVRLFAGTQAMVGEYSVTFGVRDTAGANHSRTIKLTIENVNDPPVAEKIQAVGGFKNLTIVVSTDAAFDLDGDELTYIWDLGDGSVKSEGVDLLSVSHTYGQPGTYYLELTVTDGFLSDTEQFQMTVTAPDPEPLPDDDDDVDDDIEPPPDDDKNNTGNETDPLDEDPDDKGGGLKDYLLWIIILVIILIGVIVIIALVVYKKNQDEKKKKKKKKKEQKPLPEPEAEEEEAGSLEDDYVEPELPEPSFTESYPVDEMPAMDSLAPREDQLALPEPTPAAADAEQEEANGEHGKATPSLDDIFGGIDGGGGGDPEPDPAVDESVADDGPGEAGNGDAAAEDDGTKPLVAGMDPELANIFSPIETSTYSSEVAAAQADDPAPSGESDNEESWVQVGQSVEVPCKSCGETMAVEITQLPMNIACWNCGTADTIE